MDLADVRLKMEKALDLLRQDLLTIKAGRATPAMIEQIMVEAYETKMLLVELATISAPNANELLVTPFDQTILKNIERALALDRGLGLSPIFEETAIRLRLPPLTEERRQELVKLLGQKLETVRIMIRQIRGEKMRELRDASQRKELNEDEHFRLENDLQKLTDEYNSRISQIGKAKEEELMRV